MGELKKIIVLGTESSDLTEVFAISFVHGTDIRLLFFFPEITRSTWRVLGASQA